MSEKNTTNNTAIETVDNKNSYEVASQWKLMWWKFKKHKAAMISVPILIIMYIICMCCEFFAPSLPLERYKDYKDTAPTKIHLWDDNGDFQGPFVYGLTRFTDPYTYRKTYIENDDIVKLGFFVRGSEYNVFGISSIQWDRHFFGAVLQDGVANGMSVDKEEIIVSATPVTSEITGHEWLEVTMEDGDVGYIFEDLTEDKAPIWYGVEEWNATGYYGSVVAADAKLFANIDDADPVMDVANGTYIISATEAVSETSEFEWLEVTLESGETGYILKDKTATGIPNRFRDELFAAAGLYGYVTKDSDLFSNEDGLAREKPGDKIFFLMGTDTLGRDVFSRILSGGRISLSFCLVSVFFTVAIGLTLGGISGYLGGIADTVVQRAIDIIMSIPGIPMWMALAAALPSTMSNLKKYFLMSLIMSLIGWTGLARVTRGKILSLREEDFVTAARMCGSSHARVIFKHMLPSFLSYIIVSVTGSIPGTILGETSLSFLGLGLQAPTVSWGTLLQDCQTVDSMAATPWLMFPAVFIIISVLCFCFMGDGLRDAADPYK